MVRYLPLAILFVLLWVEATSHGDDRTWTSRDGKFRVVAELIRVENDVVVLRRSDGKTARVPVSRLSDDDQEFLSDQQKATTSSLPTGAAHYRSVALQNVEVGADSTTGVLRCRMPRELARQALLIAARDGLGLGTYDGTIREPMPAPTDATVLRLHIAAIPGEDGRLRVRLWQGSAVNGDPVWSKEYPYEMQVLEMYPSIVKQVSADARAEMLTLLQKLGCQQLKPEGVASRLSPSAVEQLLLEPDIITQFLAVRLAHRALRQQAQDTTALGVLVRGYANLSRLTTHYWTATTQALLARSMLYADRLVQIGDDRATALLHRAYALAISGQHAAGLVDLEQARAELSELPEWADIIEPYCRYQIDALTRVGKQHPSLEPEGEWLAFHLAEGTLDGQKMNAVINEMVAKQRMPVQLFADLTGGDLQIRRWAATNGPRVLQASVEAHLPEIIDLPEPVLKDFDWEAYSTPLQLVAELARRLRAVDRVESTEEPSWGMLGSLLQDEVFVMTVSWLHAATSGVQVSLTETIDELLPGVADHPFAAYIESFEVDRKRDFGRYVQILDKLEIVDPPIHMTRFIHNMKGVSTPRYGSLGDYVVQHGGMEYTFQSMRQRINYGFPTVEAQRGFADALAQVSPDAPLLARVQLALADAPAADDMAELEKKNWDDAALMEQLGGKYETAKRFDDAKRAYGRALELAPTTERCLLLGLLYWREDDLKSWQETLEAFLDTPDTGLGHARVHSELAKGLMLMQRWKEAEPHAVAAAESMSAWGLQTASECYEGLKQWDKSEDYIRLAAENYGGASWAEWYFWCRRTGHGHLDDARQAAEEYFQDGGNPRDLARIGHLAMYYQMEGETTKAIAAYKAGIKLRPSLWWTIHVAILAKQSDDQQTLEEAVASLQEIAGSESLARSRHRMQLAALVASALAPRGGEQITLEQVEQVVNDSPDRTTKVDVRYFAGSILYLTDRMTEARKYWQNAMERGPFERPGSSLSGFRFHETGAEK